MERPEPYSWAFHHIQLPLARLVAWVLFTVLGPFRIEGRSNVPKEGGLLLLANHISDVDPVAIQLACPRPIRFMAKSELFEMAGVNIALRWLKAFPVKRGEPDRAALRTAADYVRAGECVCVFPEGQLSETGELQELKPGVGLIARMAEAPVQCVAVNNTNRIIPYKSLIPRPAFRWVTVRFGEPKEFGPKPDPHQVMAWARDDLAKLTK